MNNQQRNSFNENNSSKELILVMEKHGTTEIFFETEFPLISGLPGEDCRGAQNPILQRKRGNRSLVSWGRRTLDRSSGEVCQARAA